MIVAAAPSIVSSAPDHDSKRSSAPAQPGALKRIGRGGGDDCIPGRAQLAARAQRSAQLAEEHLRHAGQLQLLIGLPGRTDSDARLWRYAELLVLPVLA